MTQYLGFSQVQAVPSTELLLSRSDILDIRALPSTRQQVAYRDGGLFPILALAGETVVGVMRGGAGHLGLKGRIDTVRSPDMGHTWSPPAVVVDSERDDRDYAFGATAKGTLVLAYHRTGQYDETGLWRLEPFEAAGDERIDIQVTRSHDGGLTWETPYPFACEGLRAGNPFGKMVSLADGTLLTAVYAPPSRALLGDDRFQMADGADCSYLARSYDDGRTWVEPTVMGVRYNETGLIALPDGDVLAVMRSFAPEQALYTTRSPDGGRTWSAPMRLTEACQHPADVVQLSDGSLLLTYGNRTAPYRVEGRVSRDGGRSWLDVLLAFTAPLYGYAIEDNRPTDLGYPSSVVRQGQGVTMYYYNPAVRYAWREDNSARERFYQPTHYTAVAVTWDERELLAALE